MLKIRLARVGKKNSPAYRVVIADKRRAVKGKFIEIIGNYNPILKPKQIVINKERALFWLGRGAQASDTVNNLMCDLEILPKNKKIKTTFGKKLTKKAIKEGAGKPKMDSESSPRRDPVQNAGQNKPRNEEKIEDISEKTTEPEAKVEAEVAPTLQSESRHEVVGKESQSEIATEETLSETPAEEIVKTEIEIPAEDIKTEENTENSTEKPTEKNKKEN